MNSAARTTCASGPLFAPRQAGDPALDRAAQQPVPARVEVDLVDPVAVAVVGAQDGRFRSARRPCSAASTLPAAPPVSRARSTPQPPPSRSSPSRSARSLSNRLIGCSGGGWLSTSRAGLVTSIVVHRSAHPAIAPTERPLGHLIDGVPGAAEQAPRELRAAVEERRIVLPGRADPAVDIDHGPAGDIECLAPPPPAPRSRRAGTPRAWRRGPSRRSTGGRGCSPGGEAPRSARA